MNTDQANLTLQELKDEYSAHKGFTAETHGRWVNSFTIDTAAILPADEEFANQLTLAGRTLGWDKSGTTTVITYTRP